MVATFASQAPAVAVRARTFSTLTRVDLLEARMFGVGDGGRNGVTAVTSRDSAAPIGHAKLAATYISIVLHAL